MKRWLVFGEEHNFIGVIHDKTVLKLFKKQRDMNMFRIEKVDLDDPSMAPALASLDEHYHEALIHYGQVMFQGEIDVMNSTESQFEYELLSSVGEYIKEFAPYLKLPDAEKELVNALMMHMYSSLKAYEEMINDDDYMDGEEDFLDHEYIARKTVSYYGGKDSDD